MNFYDATIPLLDRTMQQLSGILDKAAAYAAERKVEESVLLGMRLYPDMFALTRQVQVSCDFAKNCTPRILGQEPVKFEDNEKSFAELQTRIATVRAMLAKVTPEQVNGHEAATVTLKLRGEEVSLPAQKYVQRMVLPNLYFHSATAYNILRHAGVPVGKTDFIGAMDPKA
jgi:uncharacterized protein